jgi:hypothetical protein
LLHSKVDFAVVESGCQDLRSIEKVLEDLVSLKAQNCILTLQDLLVQMIKMNLGPRVEQEPPTVLEY